MKATRLLSMILALICLFALPVFANETTEAAGVDTQEINLPVPTIDQAVLTTNEEGKTVIRVTGTPHEKIAEIDAYLQSKQSYLIDVEFQININNEGFVTVSSNGELASTGEYTCFVPKSYKGNVYDPENAYIQLQMRYVYDYDWMRIKQSEWSNMLEVNSHLAGLDPEQSAKNAANMTSLLWIGGAVLLVVLLVVVLMGGDVRCPNCRCRVQKKQKNCPKCGHDMKIKKIARDKGEANGDKGSDA